MLKNYIKIAFRNLFKQKLYSAINIFGLAVGIASCVLIGLYVQNEWSFDEFHSKSDRIYRAWVEQPTQAGQKTINTATPLALGPALHNNIPEVETVAYLYNFSNLVRHGKTPDAFEENVLVAGADFFRIFDFNLLHGNPSTVFSDPSSIVITPETAIQFFGNKSPVGENISIRLGSEFHEFTVSGIIEEAPINSSLQYRMIIPDENLKYLISEQQRESWFNIFGSTYVLLRDDAEVSALSDKFDKMLQGILGDEVHSETNYTIGLQPLTDIHLNTDFPSNLASVSDPVYSYILGAVALLILLIACVNFMTLSISRSAARAKEVGIRKTIGALRYHLMGQFWGEALLMTALSLAAGVMLAELLLPLFNDLSGTSLDLSFTYQTITVMGGAVVLVSLIAGIYPALILSGFQPVEVLKGRLSLSADKSFFRQTMVVVQFALSIALITGTFIVHKQLNYVQQKDLGYQKDQMLVVKSGFSPGPRTPLSRVIENSFQRKRILQSEMKGISGVKSITASSFTPVQTAGWFRLGFRNDQNEMKSFHGNIVDEDFIPTMGIKLIEGRNFSKDNPSDRQRALIVNREMVEYFGWENPIGARLPGPEFNDHEIIGVVENFHYESLHTPVEPLALAMSYELLLSGVNNMSLSNSSAPRYSLKLSTDNLPSLMDRIREGWEKVAPEAPFEYAFVDDALNSQYRQEQQLSRIVTAGSVIAIVIACMGLFGLASLMVIRRTKEIGVRKVLGASIREIIFLVNKEFTRLVGIAFLIAVPGAWLVMQQWLQDFSYRISLGPGIFLLTGALTMLVAWLTVGYQSWKAAHINPVDSLRSE